MQLREPCECCGLREALHWMEWGEWLCDGCAAQAVEDDQTEDEPTLLE